MEDLKRERGLRDRDCDREEKPLVPNGFGVARIVGFGGELVIRVDPEYRVGFQIPVLPVHVLQVLAGDDR